MPGKGITAFVAVFGVEACGAYLICLKAPPFWNLAAATGKRWPECPAAGRLLP
jgi:hypothetical protein